MTGLESSFAGKGYGFETGRKAPVLEPVLSYRISLPEGSNVHECYLKLCQLEEEEPQLHIVWDEQAREIQASKLPCNGSFIFFTSSALL